MFASSDQCAYAYHLVEEVRAERLTRRELIRKASVAGFSASALAFMLSACGGGGEAEKATTGATTEAAEKDVRRGGVGRIAAIAPTADVDPVTGYSDGGARTAQVAGEYLCFPNADFTLDPRLATKWEAANPDEWTFTIREGVSWHDGSPLTVEDVIHSFDLFTDPKGNSGALSAFQGILSAGNAEKIDEHTITFHLDRPFVDFPYLVSAFNFNTIILPKTYEVGSGAFTKGGIGTGPYILQSFEPTQGATFVKNENYWDPDLPYMDGLELKFFADTAPEILAIQAGEIDAIAFVPFQGSEALFSDPNITVLENPSSGYNTLQMRVDKPPFDDKRVRQAVAISLDRPALVEGLFGGRAVAGNDHGFAPVFPTSPGPDLVAQRVQDYDMAKTLLADAGYADGLDVTLTTEQYLEIPQYAVFVKEHCKPAGINVQLKILSQTAFYGSGDNQPWLEVPFGITDWSARGTASQLIAAAYLCQSVWNSAHWCNNEFDNIMGQFDAELDEQRRRELAVKAATIQRDEVPAGIGYWSNDLRAIRKNVQGLPQGPNHLDVQRMWLSS